MASAARLPVRYPQSFSAPEAAVDRQFPSGPAPSHPRPARPQQPDRLHRPHRYSRQCPGIRPAFWRFCSTTARNSSSHCHSNHRPAIPPLPEGECRDEGECAQPARFTYDSRNLGYEILVALTVRGRRHVKIPPNTGWYALATTLISGWWLWITLPQDAPYCCTEWNSVWTSIPVLRRLAPWKKKSAGCCEKFATFPD